MKKENRISHARKNKQSTIKLSKRNRELDLVNGKLLPYPPKVVKLPDYPQF